jgi:hypothetical protein
VVVVAPLTGGSGSISGAGRVPRPLSLRRSRSPRTGSYPIDRGRDRGTAAAWRALALLVGSTPSRSTRTMWARPRSGPASTTGGLPLVFGVKLFRRACGFPRFVTAERIDRQRTPLAGGLRRARVPVRQRNECGRCDRKYAPCRANRHACRKNRHGPPQCRDNAAHHAPDCLTYATPSPKRHPIDYTFNCRQFDYNACSAGPSEHTRLNFNNPSIFPSIGTHHPIGKVYSV